MNRRNFSKLIPTLMAAPLINNLDPNPKVKFKPLKKGDTVGLVTPSGPISQKRLDNALANMKALELKAVYTDQVMAIDGYLAGSDESRVQELHEMYENPKVDAIWSVRGGYGATRYLDQLDFDLIKKNPKPLIGYSDITALLNTIYQKTANPCFHGPIAGSLFSDYTQAGLAPLFSKKEVDFSLSANNIERGKKESAYQYRVIVDGKIEGALCGGNLSLLTSLVGTKHAVETKGKVVFIEDVGEEPYRIDRMLTQLISSGFFNEVKGIILGVFADCEKKDEHSWTLQETITERLKVIGKPCVYGYSFGHIKDQLTFPIGRAIKLNPDQGLLSVKPDF